jgi:HAMP domain-containing protein
MASAQTYRRTRKSPRFWDIPNWRMGAKLLFAFLLVLALPLFISAVATISVSRNTLLAEGVSILTAQGSDTSIALDNYLTIHRDDVLMASQLPDVVSFALNPNDATARTNALAALSVLATRPDYSSVAIVNRQGDVLYSTDSGDTAEAVSSRQYFQPAIGGQAYISDLLISERTHLPYIFFSAPVRNSTGNIIGILRSRLTLTGIDGIVENDLGQAGVGSFGMLLDENGIRLATSMSKGNRDAVERNLLLRAIAPLPDSVAQNLLADNRVVAPASGTAQVIPLPELSNALATHVDSSFESSADNSTARHRAIISPLRVKPWYYVMMAPVSSFTSAADNLLLVFLIVFIVIGAATAVSVVFLTRTFTTPIVQLTRAADRISMGEMDTQIEVTRSDEIGELAEAFVRMQASLQAAIERLRARRTT